MDNVALRSTIWSIVKKHGASLFLVLWSTLFFFNVVHIENKCIGFYDGIFYSIIYIAGVGVCIVSIIILNLFTFFYKRQINYISLVISSIVILFCWLRFYSQDKVFESPTVLCAATYTYRRDYDRYERVASGNTLTLKENGKFEILTREDCFCYYNGNYSIVNDTLRLSLNVNLLKETHGLFTKSYLIDTKNGLLLPIRKNTVVKKMSRYLIILKENSEE